jgi:hypothetical protein
MRVYSSSVGLVVDGKFGLDQAAEEECFPGPQQKTNMIKINGHFGASYFDLIATALTGAKVKRWMGVGPKYWSAARCAAVP